MNLLIDLGTLLLIWLLVVAAAIFVVGAAMTQRALYRSQKATIKHPRLAPGEVVIFETRKGKPLPFVIVTEKFDGSRDYVTLQDQASFAADRRHDEIPT